MARSSYRLGGVISVSLTLIVLASAAAASEKPQDQEQIQTSSSSIQKPAPKLHVKKGSKDDIDAIGKRSIASGPNWYSPDKEIALGKEDAILIESRYKRLDDPSINQYIDRIGQKLVNNSDAKVPFTIKVIDSDEVNAFSLPGGSLYVNSGLILGSENEAELAGVMAHAIAHVAAHHAARLLTREQLVNMLESPKLSVIHDSRSDGHGLATPLTLLKFRRAYEEEADYFGIQYLYKAGYDPMAFVALLERDYKKNPAKPGSLAANFADEPLPVERLAAARKEIARILPPADNLVVNTPEFEAVKARVAALKAPPPQDNQAPK